MNASKVLYAYTNCSSGGMSTVYRSRAVERPTTAFDLVFQHDKGGRSRFVDLDNVSLRVVDKGRLEAFLAYAVRNRRYDDVSITSLPEFASSVAKSTNVPVHYEFHTSTVDVIQKELERLDLNAISGIRVPSAYLADMVMQELPVSSRGLVEVVPNDIDHEVFEPTGSTMRAHLGPKDLPLVWIGRFDRGKNYRDFLRLLSLLPKRFVGIVIVSLESDPSRMAEFLGDVGHYQVGNRVKVLMNLDQHAVASIYRGAAIAGGAFVSTSLAESFGYGVVEAMACGLSVFAYDAGALHEHTAREGDLSLFDLGDIDGMAQALVSRVDEKGQRNVGP
ncbi:MAG TPA: glycosyltransferase family 4 protein [Propionibacteriaceae bacterium]|jgi:glycosyltransferase involved in cell wall biosynthesis